MKKQLTFALIALIAVVGGLFYSCSKESTSEDQLTLKAAKVTTLANSISTQADCSSSSINPESSAYFEKTYTLNYTSGPQGYATVVVYNTPNNIVYKITSSTGADLRRITFNGQDKYTSNTPATEPYIVTVPLADNWKGCDEITAKIEVRRTNSDGTGGGQYLLFNTSYNLIALATKTTLEASATSNICVGTSVQLTATVSAGTYAVHGGTLTIKDEDNNTIAAMVVTSANNTLVGTYTPTAATTQRFTAYFDGIASNGKASNSVGVDVTSVVCTPPGAGNTCTESFSYVKNENDLTYTFTYRSPEKLENATVKFTCPHVSAVTSADGKTLTSNPGKGKGSPTVITWEGTINPCEEISFKLQFSPDCDQNDAGFANLWTDFSVNEKSKKTLETETIKYQCPK